MIELSTADIILGLIKAVIGFSVLILAHELGHFIVAKRAGVWVEEFGLGIPPRLIGKKIGETIYSLNLFPLGGFVRLHGESSEEGLKKPKRAFLRKSKKARSFIITGGIFGNLLLAVVAFGLVYSISGIPRESENVSVLEVRPGSPAESAGMLVEDIVREVDGERITSTRQFIDEVGERRGESVIVKVEREGGNFLELVLVPRLEPPENEGPIGVAISSVEPYFPPIWQRPFYGAYYGFGEALFWVKTVVKGLGGAAAAVTRGQAPEGLAGPFTIVALFIYVAKIGFLPFTNLVGIISVNLAILNLIPFPALDGSRLVSIGFESIFGRRVLPKVEATIHAIGMIFLILLILALTSKEIAIFRSLGLSGFLENILK
ncbi:site-2 protease family protein [Patescibacteria group bacterium]|nr:site-2 protease family protein [Patescibacteria group bacterium]